MATKKSAKAPTKKPAKKAPAPAAAVKPIKETLNKSGLISYVAETSGVAAKDVRSVLAALESAVLGSVDKKGAGKFVLPGLLQVTTVKVAAKPKRKGINPFTKEEVWFAAKPASTKVKVRALSKLRKAV